MVCEILLSSILGFGIGQKNDRTHPIFPQAFLSRLELTSLDPYNPFDSTESIYNDQLLAI